MLLHIRHRTLYRYMSPARESHNEVRLKPASDDRQTRLDFRLTLDPPAVARHYTGIGGDVHFFNVRDPHDTLEIVSESHVETRPASAIRDPLTSWSFYADPSIRQDYAEYLAPSRCVPILPEVREMAEGLKRAGGPSPTEFMDAITRHIEKSLTYEPGATSSTTPLEEFVRQGRGVCQDFAHLLLSACRSSSIPCRYVSGYLYTVDETGAELGPGATHAWVECLLPDGTWREYDPTNPDKTRDHYVKIHHGRDYADVVPVKGVFVGAGSHTLSVEVQVSSIHPPPE